MGLVLGKAAKHMRRAEIQTDVEKRILNDVWVEFQPLYAA